MSCATTPAQLAIGVLDGSVCPIVTDAPTDEALAVSAATRITKDASKKRLKKRLFIDLDRIPTRERLSNLESVFGVSRTSRPSRAARTAFSRWDAEGSR